MSESARKKQRVSVGDFDPSESADPTLHGDVCTSAHGTVGTIC
jgi:hypothetical protein